jgi:hypothetical protein
MKQYLIHDNGGRPYLVKLDKSVADIYTYDKNAEVYDKHGNEKPITKKDYTILVKSYKYKTAHVGSSPLNEMTKFSGGHGRKFHGNTVLLQLTDKRYVFIGHQIFEFTMDEKVVTYLSPVGNNDVPYPYIVGENNVYFLLDKKFVSKSEFPIKFKKNMKRDLYNFYYFGTDELDPLKNIAKKMKSVKFIKK